MIHIDFDMGDAPSVLEALRNPANAQRVANAAAESYTDDILDWIAEGRSFTPRTEQLGQSISWRGLGNGEAEVYVNAGIHTSPDGLEMPMQELANYMEAGTRPHVIRPKPGRKGVKIPVSGGGGYIVRRSFNHPGTTAKPFFFADRAARGEHMRERGLSVLASHIHG